MLDGLSRRCLWDIQMAASSRQWVSCLKLSREVREELQIWDHGHQDGMGRGGSLGGVTERPRTEP